MSLSDDAVQTMLKKEFVSGWINTEGQSSAGGSFAHSPEDAAGSCVRGNGKANVQLLVLTPDGRLVHATSGYVGPKDLVAELKWALDTIALTKKAPTLEKAVVEERARDYRSSDLMEGEETLSPLFDTRKLPKGTQVDRDTTGMAEKVRAALADHRARGATSDSRFVEKHALLPIARFRTSMLGGGGAQFFGSRSGRGKGETIGNVGAGIEDILGGDCPMPGDADTTPSSGS